MSSTSNSSNNNGRSHVTPTKQQQQQQQSNNNNNNNNNIRHPPLFTKSPRPRTSSRDSDGSPKIRFPNSNSYASKNNQSNCGVLVDDVEQFECVKQSQIISKLSPLVFWMAYLTILLVLYMMSLAFSHPLTVLNWLHLLFCLYVLHWKKGSFLFDDSGELNHMTLWEQLDRTPESNLHMRNTLKLVPCVLCYIAILVSNFDRSSVVFNTVALVIQLIPKFPFMDGVRIWNINSTPGIDDDKKPKRL